MNIILGGGGKSDCIVIIWSIIAERDNVKTGPEMFVPAGSYSGPLPAAKAKRGGAVRDGNTMEKDRGSTEFSILGLQGGGRPPREAPAYFRDLNLDMVLDELALEWGSGVRKLFLSLPETPEGEEYRRAVYGDVKKEGVYAALTAYVRGMAAAEDLRREKERVPGKMQRAVWQVRETEARCGACTELCGALEKEELSSRGMRRFRELLKETLESAGFIEMRDLARRIMERIRSLRLVITYEKERIRVEEGEVSGEYAALPDAPPRPLRNPFAVSPMLTELEAACLEILEKKEPAFFRSLRDGSRLWAEGEFPVIERFTGEIPFYLSYAALQREMEGRGFPFASPSVSEALPLRAGGLYDLALACAFRREGKRVVANDFDCRPGERFFVLTGPNQGGKTTFARSLGQLVYFARIGLDVPAAEANVPFFRDIQTHFSVEESTETGRGKLKEELVRLAPMMEENRRGTFVVINELFTTAASRDAVIMGRRVLAHFIALGCMGIYVTHLQQLAASGEGTSSLRAMLDENRRPTYEIRRGEAEDIPSAENLVSRYRLTYEQLKERL